MAAHVTLTREDDVVVCDDCLVMTAALERMRGFLGRREPATGEGILLRPAASVHTWFMRFPIDVVFLDAELAVLSISHSLRPWRVAAHRGAKSVLELGAGESARVGLRPGDRLVLVPA